MGSVLAFALGELASQRQVRVGGSCAAASPNNERRATHAHEANQHRAISLQFVERSYRRARASNLVQICPSLLLENLLALFGDRGHEHDDEDEAEQQRRRFALEFYEHTTKQLKTATVNKSKALEFTLYTPMALKARIAGNST